MRLLELTRQLNDLFYEYGDVEVDILVEDLDSFGQIEMQLGEIAVDPSNPPRIKLLSEGFT